MKVVVLDIDQNHNLRLKQAFKDNAKIEMIFAASFDELLRLVNGQSVDEEKLKRLEKSLIDGAAMFARASDGIQKATQLAEEKKARSATLTAIGQAEERKKLDEEISALNAKIASTVELKKKIESAIAARKKEIEASRAKNSGEGAGSEGSGGGKSDLVLVDRAFLGNLPSDWNIELRAKISMADNKDVPVIAMGYNEDLNYIKNTLHGGVRNYFVKPVDQLLLQQTLDSTQKVFELETETPIRILKGATVRKLSEFDIHLDCDTPFQIGELVEFYVDIFGGEKDKRVLARCERSEPKEGANHTFVSHFMIVGHTPHTMTEMRKWIRARYVTRKKED